MSDNDEPESKRLKTESKVERRTINYEESIFENELILNHIFKNLTAKELRSISRVCKTWHNLTTKLSKKYSHIEDLFLTYGISVDYMHHHSDRYSKFITLKDLGNYHALKEEILYSFKHRLQGVPSIAIFFNSFKGLQQRYHSKFLNNSKTLELLPRSCSVMSVSVNYTGVVINDKIGPVETMQDHKFISGISYLFLPDLTADGCQILPFKGCHSELCRYLNEEQIIERNIKGVITFIKFTTEATPDLNILIEILRKQRNKVALAGVMVEQIDVSSNVDCKMSSSDEPKSMVKSNFSALMFCGENVSCASLVINVTEVKEVKNRLISFKNNLHFNPNQPDCEFFGFLFVCAGRGYNIFINLNLESDMIKEQFPNIKLYGIFGLGEIGINHFGTYRSNKICKDTVTHDHTTILFLVHITKR